MRRGLIEYLLPSYWASALINGDYSVLMLDNLNLKREWVMKKLFDYLLFRDMGSLGEGCLISGFMWFIIVLIIVMALCG